MKNFVVEIHAITNDSGDAQIFYLCTGTGFATKPTDTPPNTWIQPRIIDPGSFRRDLFGSAGRFFGAISPSYGDITIANADGGLDDWVNYGFQGTTVTIRYGDDGAEYPGGYDTVINSVSAGIEFTLKDIRLFLADKLKYLDKPVVNQTFNGTGGLQGTNADILKQRVFLSPGYIPMQMIDQSNLIYFVQQESPGVSGAVFDVYEGGVLITKGSNYASASDVISVSPSVGECRFWFGDGNGGPVYVRLGSTPAFDLRCVAAGYKDSAGNNHTMQTLAEECGLSLSVSGYPISERYIGDIGVSYLDLFEDNCKSSFSFFGFDRLGNFDAGVFNEPDVAADYAFNQHNATDIEKSSARDITSPVHRFNFRIGQMYPANYAGGADNSMKDILKREWWVQASKEDAQVLIKFPNAPTINVDIYASVIKNTTFLNLITDKYQDLFGVKREMVTLTTQLNSDTLQIDINSTVSVTIPRYGLSVGKNYRVVGQDIDMLSMRITYLLWG